MSYDLYPTSSIITSNIVDSSTLFPVGSGGNEIDLREEFRRLLYGFGQELPKGQKGILRRMRIDDDGNKIQCSCVDELTHEPDKDFACPYCLGEGYYWDEEWITYYKTLVSSNEGLVRKNQLEKGGITNIPFAFFYLEYQVSPTVYDRIIEVERELSGDPNTPYVRSALFGISTAQSFRSDQGRIEYWRLATVRHNIHSTWWQELKWQ